MSDDDFDFGFTTVDRKESPLSDPIVRLAKVKDMIEPFLDNLSQSPEKDIHWPDRDVKIAEFKRRLWDVIDGRTP